jgi:Protein of unknown function (DUF3714).
MKNKQSNLASRRKGVFLLCLPVLIVPLLFLLGMTDRGGEPVEEIPKGFNQEMPEVLIREKKTSKSEAYSLEEKLKREPKELEMPAFLQKSLVGSGTGLEMGDLDGSALIPESPKKSLPSFAGSDRAGQAEELDPEEAMMNQLRELEKLLSQKPEELIEKTSKKDLDPLSISEDLTEEKQKWEAMMDGLESKSGTDPELEQLEGLIDKLVLLQQGMDQPQLKSEFPVSTGMEAVAVSSKHEEVNQSLEWKQLPEFQDEAMLSNGFFGLEEQVYTPAVSDSFRSTIRAYVSESQEILPGEAVELILDQDLILGSVQIPAGTVLHANTSLAGARLQLQVSGIVWKDQLIPVELKAYGLDGLPGMEIADQKVASQWLDQSAQGVQGMRFNTMGMDWQSQLATTGMEASRSLIRAKSRIRKLQIKAGHPLLLIDFSTANPKN